MDSQTQAGDQSEPPIKPARILFIQSPELAFSGRFMVSQLVPLLNDTTLGFPLYTVEIETPILYIYICLHIYIFHLFTFC